MALTVASQISQNLLLETKLNHGNIQETSVMLLLQNTTEEARKRNYKKALVEFHQSFKETKNDVDIFLSKLLELKFKELELLFLCLFGCDKNRRSSKQHEKKASNPKKKIAVSDFSFSNNAYELEAAKPVSKGENQSGDHNSQKTHSLRIFKDPPNFIDISNQVKDCLRRAFYLVRDLNSSKTREQSLKAILEIHYKVENYYPCAVLFVENRDQKFIDKLIFELDDTRRYKLCQICLLVATNVTQYYRKIDTLTSLNFCKLACKLSPQDKRANEILCYLYRQNNETENAFSVAKHYLDEIQSNSPSILIQMFLCEIDYGKIDQVLSHLTKLMIEQAEGFVNYLILRILTLIYSSKVVDGIQMLESLDVNENKDLIKSICDQVRSGFLESIVKEMFTYLKLRKEELNPDKRTEDVEVFFLMISQFLAIKNVHQIKFAKIYVDNLLLCGKNEIATTYLTQLIKLHKDEVLPMLILATLTLKMAAYVAGTEDFRMILNMAGEEKLKTDMQLLSDDEKEEIARVHRLHAFRFLSKDGSYQDAIECFTIAICSIGTKAVGLVLSRGICYMHLNNFDEASKNFDVCLKHEPKTPSAMFARAVVYAVTTHVEEAIKYFKSAFELNPTACKECLIKLPLEHALTFAQLIFQYIKQELERVRVTKKNLYIDANEFDNLKQRNVDGFDIRVTKYSLFLCNAFPGNVDYLCTHIECLYAAKDINYALRQVSIYLSVQPDRYLYAWKAVLLSFQKRCDEALSEFFQIEKLDDQIRSILLHLPPKERKFLLDLAYQKANSFYGSSQYENAVIFFNVARVLSNNDTKALKGRMKCYQKLGLIDKWLNDLSDIIKFEPNASELQLRAQHYQKEGEDTQACEDYISALKLNEQETIINVTTNSNGDDVINMFYNTAWQMVEYKKPKEVLRLCEAALKFDPKHKGLKQLRERSNSDLQKCVIQ